nr:hypothetical protein [Saccharopolyspora sp. HNM0983]
MLCPVLGRLTVWTWLCLPLLFLGSAAGVAALLELLLHPIGDAHRDLALSTPLLLGFSAGLALLSSGHVRWAPRWQLLLRGGYPMLMLGCALARDRIELPLPAALLIGLPAAVLLGLVLIRYRPTNDRTRCPAPAERR